MGELVESLLGILEEVFFFTALAAALLPFPGLITATITNRQIQLSLPFGVQT